MIYVDSDGHPETTVDDPRGTQTATWEQLHLFKGIKRVLASYLELRCVSHLLRILD